MSVVEVYTNKVSGVTAPFAWLAGELKAQIKPQAQHSSCVNNQAPSQQSHEVMTVSNPSGGSVFGHLVLLPFR